MSTPINPKQLKLTPLAGNWKTKCCQCGKEYDGGVGSTPCCGSIQEIIQSPANIEEIASKWAQLRADNNGTMSTQRAILCALYDLSAFMKTIDLTELRDFIIEIQSDGARKESTARREEKHASEIYHNGRQTGLCELVVKIADIYGKDWGLRREEQETCEGCGVPATTRDPEGIPLCAECAKLP